MTLVLLASVLPLQFALLNLSTRNRHNLRRYAFETLEWSFLFGRLVLAHRNSNAGGMLGKFPKYQRLKLRFERRA